jgi:hypothetical protein
LQNESERKRQSRVDLKRKRDNIAITREKEDMRLSFEHHNEATFHESLGFALPLEIPSIWYILPLAGSELCHEGMYDTFAFDG